MKATFNSKLFKLKYKRNVYLITFWLMLLFASALAKIQAQTCKEIVGYYPNWQWYDRNKLVKPATINYEKYSILNYCFFNPQSNGTIQITDPWADKNLLLGPINWSVAPAGYDTGYDFGNPAYHIPGQKLSQYCHNNGVKLLPSIGGWTLSNNFPIIAADPIKRQQFAQSCVQLIQAFDFDGIDLDWEYPGFVDHNGTPADKVNFTLLLQAVRTAIDNYGATVNKTMLLTIAVGASSTHMSNVEWNNITPIVDIINVMSYDFFGTWDSQANHNSPLFAPTQGDPTFNVNSAVQQLLTTYNVPANKITAGVAFYGRSAKTISTPALFAPTNGMADLQTFSVDDGTPLYYNTLANLHLFDQHWDNTAKVPYLTGKNGLNTFLSYDNELSIQYKAEYIVDHNLRGAIIWEITGDYIETAPNSGIVGSTPLVDKLNYVFCNYVSDGNGNGGDDDGSGNDGDDDGSGNDDDDSGDDDGGDDNGTGNGDDDSDNGTGDGDDDDSGDNGDDNGTGNGDDDDDSGNGTGNDDDDSGDDGGDDDTGNNDDVFASVQEIDFSAIVVYPNPATNTLYFSNLQFEQYNVEVYSILGQKIATLLLTNKENIAVDISFLTEGHYFIKITNEEKSIVKPIVVVK